MIKDKILVPVDFTGCAFEVVASAADLAGRLGSDAVLLYVVNLPSGVAADTIIHPHGSAEAVKAVEYLDEDAQAHLEPFVGVFTDNGAKVSIAIKHGDVVQAILDTADQVNASMIVMGTHGRTGIRRFFEGSVAENVIRRADCPVTTIRTLAPEAHPGLSDAQQQAMNEAVG